MTRVILVRHGETEWNAADRVQGSTDTALGDVGADQARELGARLASRMVAARVVSSPLERAMETARIIGVALGTEPVADARLTQRSYGAWEGMEHADIAAEFPEEHARWRQGVEPRVDGYEDDATLAVRTLEGLEAAATDGDVVIVSHGSTIRVVLQAALGLPLGRGLIGKLANCEHSELAWRDGAWQLVRHAVPLREG